MSADSLGNVRITLNGSPAVLQCTLEAFEDINAAFGSYSEAGRRVAVLDASAYVAVVAHGLGRKPDDVKRDVFRTGMPKLMPKLIEYLGLLSNGGQPLDDGKSKDTKSGEA